METDVLIAAASALSFAALFILWGLAPTHPEPETVPAKPVAEPVA